MVQAQLVVEDAEGPHGLGKGVWSKGELVKVRAGSRPIRVARLLVLLTTSRTLSWPLQSLPELLQHA